jgi:iron complex transport system ATP-binding protein
VQVRIDGRTILGPVTLSIGRGEHWVLVGPNGSGKTTMLTVAGGWRQPSAGRVDVLGHRVGRVDLRQLRRRVGHVSHSVADKLRPQQTALDVVLTGATSVLVTWFLEFSEADVTAALEALTAAGCEQLASQPFGSLSLGERQRVLIARALFGAHELLLFDEPAAGLDLPARERLLEAMTSLAGRSDAPTTILATHHLEEIPPSMTHAAALRDGLLIGAGPIEEVLTNDVLSEAFDIPIAVERHGGRWSARAR